MSSRHAHLFPQSARRSGNHFRGTPARSALPWVIVSQNSSSHLLPRQPRHLHPGHPGQLAPHHLGVGQGVAGPPFLANIEVTEALAPPGMAQLTRALPARHPPPPRPPPVRAVVG